MKAFGEYVLVEKLEQPTNVNGIYTSPESFGMSKVGIVLSIGEKFELSLKEGNKIIFTGGVEINTSTLEEYLNKEIYAVKKDHILCVLDK